MSRLSRAIDRLLPVGPRSVLFGAHCFCIHPWFVAIAWWRLYGFPRDWRLWASFFVHDLGYLFQWCRNMDGPEGEAHVLWGARLMRRLAGWEWYIFCFTHSRYQAKKWNLNPSRLCVADKLAVALEPWWLYLPRVVLSGEIHEYLHHAQSGKYVSAGHATSSYRAWFASIQEYLYAWSEAHKDGAPDTWTPGRSA